MKQPILKGIVKDFSSNFKVEDAKTGVLYFIRDNKKSKKGTIYFGKCQYGASTTSLDIKGYVDTYAELADIPDPKDNDTYRVLGEFVYDEQSYAEGTMVSYDKELEEWVPLVVQSVKPTRTEFSTLGNGYAKFLEVPYGLDVRVEVSVIQNSQVSSNTLWISSRGKYHLTTAIPSVFSYIDGSYLGMPNRLFVLVKQDGNVAPDIQTIKISSRLTYCNSYYDNLNYYHLRWFDGSEEIAASQIANVVRAKVLLSDTTQDFSADNTYSTTATTTAGVSSASILVREGIENYIVNLNTCESENDVVLKTTSSEGTIDLVNLPNGIYRFVFTKNIEGNVSVNTSSKTYTYANTSVIPKNSILTLSVSDVFYEWSLSTPKVYSEDNSVKVSIDENGGFNLTVPQTTIIIDEDGREYLSGVTVNKSSSKVSINNNVADITLSASPNSVIVSDANGEFIANTAVTLSELNKLSGVTGSIQSQINNTITGVTINNSSEGVSISGRVVNLTIADYSYLLERIETLEEEMAQVISALKIKQQS